MTKFIHQPVNLSAAADFVAAHHRHSKPLKRHRFSIGAWTNRAYAMYEAQNKQTDNMLGVVTVCNCSSRGWSSLNHMAEIRRVCTRPDTPKNTASFLISKARDACFAMGHDYVVTYTKASERGSSLLAAGFEMIDYKINSDGSGRMCWMASSDGFKCLGDDWRVFPGEGTRDDLRAWARSRLKKVQDLIATDKKGFQ